MDKLSRGTYIWFHVRASQQKDLYGQTFRRARLEAAARLGLPLDDRAAAAQLIGLSDGFLKKIEAGEKRPSFETLEAMARVYNVMIGDLFPTSAPRGAEVDRVLGPLMALEPRTRDRFMSEIGALARTLATEMHYAQTLATDADRDARVAGKGEERAVVPIV